MTTKKQQSFASRLKEKRMAAGLTQEQLSKRSGISQPFISQMEKGDKMPGVMKLFTLSVALHCKIDDLISYEDYQEMAKGQGEKQ